MRNNAEGIIITVFWKNNGAKKGGVPKDTLAEPLLKTLAL